MSAIDHFCSSCGKGKEDVVQLVAGPKAMICDACICLSLGTVLSAGAKQAHSRLDALEAKPEPRSELSASAFDRLAACVMKLENMENRRQCSRRRLQDVAFITAISLMIALVIAATVFLWGAAA